MRSEDDIREALEALADTAPDADDVLARVRARERRERRTAFHTPVLVGISAVATAAAAFAVPLAIDPPGVDAPVAGASTPTSSPARVNPRWQRYFTFSLPPGYQLESQLITPLYQIATVRAPSAIWCEVMVYEWNAFDAKRVPAKRTAVRLYDVTGYAAAFNDPRSSLPGSRPRIAWEYSLEMWATAACMGKPTDQVRAAERVVAKAVRHTGQSLPMPFRIGYLPAGVSVYSAGSVDTAAAVRTMTALSGPTVDLSTASKVVTTQTASGTVVTKGIPNLVIEFRKGNSVPPGARFISVAGRPAWMTKYGLLVHLDGHEVRIASVAGPAGTSSEELIQIAEGMEFAPDLADESTWFDGTVAIP